MLSWKKLKLFIATLGSFDDLKYTKSLQRFLITHFFLISKISVAKNRQKWNITRFIKSDANCYQNGCSCIGSNKKDDGWDAFR